MWCFSCFKPSIRHDDPSKVDHKTARIISRHHEEDRIVRQEREKDEQVETERAIEISLKLSEPEEEKRREEEPKEEDKRKQVDDEQIEFEKAKQLSLKQFKQEEKKRRLEEESKEEGKRKQVGDDGDHQMEEDKRRIKHSKDDHVNPPSGCKSEIKDGLSVALPEVNPPPSKCGGCNSEIEHGRSVDVLGVLWHPECLWCDACHKPIAVLEVENHVSNSRGKFHKACHERYCYVCKEKKLKNEYYEHDFWKERYCPAHDSDGTRKCCSCERLEPRGTSFVILDDGRWLCLECMESALMDTDEVQHLHFELREFFEGLNMKIEKQFPLLLVEKQALNKAEEEEKIDNQHGEVTRGICLSEEQFVTSVLKGPKMGPNKQLIGMTTESQKVIRDCEVTAILILYGLPRLLTGYILAHEMMHAYLRLKGGQRKLNNVLEEGICQVLGHMWLESQTYATTDVTAAAASSSHTPAATTSKKGKWSDFEKKLVEFCKNQIETNDSPVYGDGFRIVNDMVANSSLQETLKFIAGG